MELRHLRYFVAVAEHLNFTRAASRLRVAQPALSRQIRDLEDELGAQLLERNSRRVSLTPAGAAFVAEAKAVLQRADAAVRAAKAFSSGEGGEIHIGYAPSPTVELLPQALRAFQEACPAVRVILHDLSAREILQGLRSGRLDAALTVKVEPREMRGLSFTAARTYPFQLAVADNHRMARCRSVLLKRIKSEPLLVYTREDYPDYFAMLCAVFGGEGKIPKIAGEHDSATSLTAAIEAGRGVAIVPSVLARLAGPRIRFIPVQPAPDPLIVGVANPRGKLAAAAQRFVIAASAFQISSPHAG